MPMASFMVGKASPGSKSNGSSSTGANTASADIVSLDGDNVPDYMERYQMRDLNKNIKDNEELLD
jgi:hypothetical protein